MIHQHFKLVDVFTAAENIVLGLPAASVKAAGRLPKRYVRFQENTALTSTRTKKIYKCP
jgi:simple sugar transport system ATP-binding protein